MSISRRAIIAGAVVLAVLLFVVIFVTVHRQPTQPITVRRVNSVQSGDVTIMTFEITNHTADTYLFSRFKIQIRNGNVWTDDLDYYRAPMLGLASRGVASYTVNVTNLPANSVVRCSIAAHKMLLGVQGFVTRAKLKLGNNRGISLNPYDRNSKVYGDDTQVVSEEWVESVIP